MPPKKQKPAAKAKKRAPGPSARAVAAAELVAAGAKTGAVAEALGVGRTQAWRILRAEETQQLVVSMVNSRVAVLSSTFDRAIQAIQDALTADRPDVWTKDAGPFPGGPDHFARMAAVQRLLQMLTAGRPKSKPPDVSEERRGMTLAELESKVHGAPTPPGV